MDNSCILNDQKGKCLINYCLKCDTLYCSHCLRSTHSGHKIFKSLTPLNASIPVTQIVLIKLKLKMLNLPRLFHYLFIYKIQELPYLLMSLQRLKYIQLTLTLNLNLNTKIKLKLPLGLNFLPGN